MPLLNDAMIYRKTEAGLEETRSRKLGLPRKTYSLLLAIDGKRSRDTLCSSLSAFGDVGAQLDQLVAQGLIEASLAPPDPALVQASAAPLVQPSFQPAQPSIQPSVQTPTQGPPQTPTQAPPPTQAPAPAALQSRAQSTKESPTDRPTTSRPSTRTASPLAPQTLPLADPVTAVLVAQTEPLPEPPIETVRQTSMERPTWWGEQLPPASTTPKRRASDFAEDGFPVLDTREFELSPPVPIVEKTAEDSDVIEMPIAQVPGDVTVTTDTSDMDINRYHSATPRVEGLASAKRLMEATLTPQASLASLDLRIAVEQCLDAAGLRRLLPEYAGVVARHMSQADFQRHIVDVLSAMEADRV